MGQGAALRRQIHAGIYQKLRFTTIQRLSNIGPHLSANVALPFSLLRQKVTELHD